MTNADRVREVRVLVDDEDFLLSIRDAAKFLGQSYWGFRTFLRRHRSEFPSAIRAGRKLYFRLGDLKGWIAQRRLA